MNRWPNRRSSVEQLKVSGLFFLPSPKCTDCKHDKRSNICKGKRSGTTVPPSHSGLSRRASRQVFTWTRTGNHPAPKWIISVIIMRLKMNLWVALFRNATEHNRCWKRLGGTEIKDYFAILGLLQAKLLCFVLSSTARVVWGLIFLWLSSLGSSALDREWALFNLGVWGVLELHGHSVST